MDKFSRRTRHRQRKLPLTKNFRIMAYPKNNTPTIHHCISTIHHFISTIHHFFSTIHHFISTIHHFISTIHHFTSKVTKICFVTFVFTDLFCFLVLCVIKPCHTLAACKDIPNGFTCTCEQGYTGNGVGTSGCVGKMLYIYDKSILSPAHFHKSAHFHNPLPFSGYGYIHRHVYDITMAIINGAYAR